MLRVYAVLDLVRVAHLGERLQVVEPLAQDDVDQIVHKVQSDQHVPEVGLRPIPEEGDPLHVRARTRQFVLRLAPGCGEGLCRLFSRYVQRPLQRGHVLLGQSLNAGIYAAIGRNGVYYGNCFGAPLGPWCSGFPFNIPGVVGRHPQYSGVLLSLWGGVLLTSDEAATAAGFPQLAILWSIFYVFTGIQEQTESTDRGAASKAQ